MGELILKIKNIKALKRSKFLISNALAWIIFLFSAFFVYKTIINYDNIEITLSNITYNLLSKNNIAHFFILALLLVTNWSLEAIKWLILVEKIEKISFLKSLESVVSGVTLSIISLIGFAGVMAGRIWHLKSERRAELIGALGVNSAFQTLVTIFWGCLGFTYYLSHKNFISVSEFQLITVAIILLHILTIWIIFNNINFIKKLKPLTRFLYQYIQIIECYDPKTLLKIYTFSFLRYSVFLIQFIVLLDALNVKLELIGLLSGISLMFITKSFAFNANAFVDLGVREFSAIFFLGYYGVDEVTAMCATFALWAINIITPSIIGLLFLFRMKIILPSKNVQD